MALKQGCNNDDIYKMLETLKATGKWEDVILALPHVDSKVLDVGFKEWAMEKAGLTKKVELAPKAAAKVDPLK